MATAAAPQASPRPTARPKRYGGDGSVGPMPLTKVSTEKTKIELDPAKTNEREFSIGLSQSGNMNFVSALGYREIGSRNSSLGRAGGASPSTQYSANPDKYRNDDQKLNDDGEPLDILMAGVVDPYVWSHEYGHVGLSVIAGTLASDPSYVLKKWGKLGSILIEYQRRLDTDEEAYKAMSRITRANASTITEASVEIFDDVDDDPLEMSQSGMGEGSRRTSLFTKAGSIDYPNIWDNIKDPDYPGKTVAPERVKELWDAMAKDVAMGTGAYLPVLHLLMGTIGEN